MISRRQFLNTLGISGAAASLGLFRNPIFAADAAKKGSPKRLIIISHAHGWVYDGWKMRPKGFVEDKEWELD